MLRRQRGATFLGMLIILGIVGFALYGGIRLTPVFLEYMAIVRALEQTAKNADGTATAQELRTSLDNRWTVEGIKSIRTKDVQIQRTNAGLTMRAVYDRKVPFVGNISLLAHFDKTVDVR